MRINIVDPKTGREGDISPDDIQGALQQGYKLAGPIHVYDPENDRTGTVEPQHIQGALEAGYLPVGSHAHAVAMTGGAESALRGAAQGASMGFADELTGLVESALSNKPYQQARDESRAAYATAEEANPTAYGAGQFGGSVATALLPIPGFGLAKGAGLAKQAILGAKLGALSGAGASTAETPTGIASDIATGAGVGAGGAAGIGLLAKGVGAVIKPATRYVQEAFDPTNQTLLAAGATVKQFKGPLGDKSADAARIARKVGLFDKLEDGTMPDIDDLAARAEAHRVEAANKLGQLFATAGDKAVDLARLEDQLTTGMSKIVQGAAPDMRATLANKMADVLDEVSATKGSLQSLWGLKKDTGSWAGKNWVRTGQSPPEAEIYMTANKLLENTLEQETSIFAQQHNIPELAELNATYGAMKTLGTILEDKIAKGAVGSAAGPRLFQTTMGGVAGAALGGAVGGPVGAGIGSIAGSLGHNFAFGTTGRLMRAQIGQAMHVAQQQQAVMHGAVPRTTKGIQMWLQQNEPQISSAMPQLAGVLKSIVASPSTMAMTAIRSIMPMVQGFMAPSPFTSELDGKVSSPQDMMHATTMIQQLQLPVNQEAQYISELNKDGTLPPDIFAPTQLPGVPQEDPAAMHSQRLKQMGY